MLFLFMGRKNMPNAEACTHCRWPTIREQPEMMQEDALSAAHSICTIQVPGAGVQLTDDKLSPIAQTGTLNSRAVG